MIEDRLSPAQLRALEAMPIKLVPHGFSWCLPYGAPHGGTVSSLERRGLIRLNAHAKRWERTPLGNLIWTAR